ncbi:MAG: hypothetical protein SNJ84_08420 [Verrucomicrobiia bacterium]
MKRLSLLIAAFLPALAPAQSPDALSSSPGSSPTPNPAPAQPAPRENSPPAAGSSFLGKDLPFLDPATGLASWDGKAWNVNNNRLFRARLEKYLNAPESDEEEKKYWALLDQIYTMLDPGRSGHRNVDQAWSLLRDAARFDIDAGISHRIADAVYAVWAAKGEQQRLDRANEKLRREVEVQQWNVEMQYRDPSLKANRSRDPGQAAAAQREQDEQRALRVAPFMERVAEGKATIASNMARKSLADASAKINFQALTLQLFVQRRFQHVHIANRFYRLLYNDGNTRIDVGEEMKLELTKGAPLPTSLEMLDSLASEAMREVREGVTAFNFLRERGELASASERLGEALAVGEFTQEIRAVPREHKRQVVEFTRKSNELISALEVRDYDAGERLLSEIRALASDFDASKPLVAIETGRNASNFHLAKAKVAATANDQATFEREFRLAAEAWPTNPALAEAGAKVFEASDAQQQTLNDLDRLIAQKNYRQIFEDKERFIVYTALNPTKRDQLRAILETMQEIEGAIIRAGEVARLGDYSGAWESVEKTFRQYSHDPKLLQLRSDYTTRAADFVRTIRQAEEMEQRGEFGSSLAWYLRAQRLYPPSDFARAGIDRTVREVLPGGN